jgi:urea transporter
MLGAAGLLGLASSTFTAWLLGADRGLIRNGLFGFNGILVGIGLAFFLQFDALLALYIIIGGAISAVVMMALINLLTPWDMPALTAPFVLTAWFFLFAVYQFGYLRPTAFIAPATPSPATPVSTALAAAPGAAGAGLTAGNLLQAFFRGLGEVMFEDNPVTGAIFLLAILVNSRFSALFAALGSAIGILVALVLGGSGVAIYHGLYGFNPVLCGIAVGGLFYVLTWRSTLYALLCAVLGTVLFASLTTLLKPIGMPALTAPFVISTWLFLWPKGLFRMLQPVALADVTTAEQIRAAHPAS